VRAVALVALVALVAACGIEGLPPAPEPTAPAVETSFDHLRRLGMDLEVGGQPVRAVALYATAPDYAPAASPARDGSEGVACVDDAARAAVVYLRRFDETGEEWARDQALGLLRFVAAMEQGDGEYLNFVAVDGTPNRDAPSSRKSFSFWAARALWALGEAARVLGRRDPDSFAPLRAVLDRTEKRFTAEVAAGRLPGGSATAGAEALLGVIARFEVERGADRAALIGHAAQLLVPLTAGGPSGARVDHPGAAWHAWGARATEALARAGAALGRPDLIDAAKSEADGLWAGLLRSGDLAAEVSAAGAPTSFPQIAYGVSSMVGGYLALADATGEERYAALAGLTGAWFLGANPTHQPMVDLASGRAFDGIDVGARINRNSGAESTIEALLALEAIGRDPVAADQLVARPRAALRSHPSGGVEVVPATTVVHLTYWPAANPRETELARRLVDRWNADHPDVQVTVQPLPAGRTSEEVLLAAIVARTTPDVCSNISSSLIARLHRAGGLVRLDRFPATAARLRERAGPDMLAPLRLPDRGIYALPWKVNPMMLLYNKRLLADAGVTPPRTHSEFLRAARALARDTDGDGRLDRWALWSPLKTTWHERFYDFYPLYLAASGGVTLLDRKGHVAFDNPAARATMRVLAAGFAAGVFPLANFSDGRDPFLDGTVAMKLIGPWFLWELEELKVAGLEYGVAPVPVPDGADPDRAYAFADMKSIAIFSTTRHPEAATRFAAWLASPAADRLMIESIAQLPYRRGLARDRRFAAAIARWQHLDAYAERVEHSRDIDIHPDVVEIFDILSEAYEAAAIYRAEPIDEALAAAAAEARVVTGER
jgi:multiple sugar transport system substrate-binding protein